MTGSLVPPAPEPLIPVGERDHAIGAEDPRLTIVEYGDFGCPHCFQAKRPLQSFLERYSDVQVAWRHFPDSEMHPGADLAAELSELAAASGRFWEAHSLLLAGRDRFTLDGLLATGRELELGPEEVESTLDERTFRARVCEDVAGGQRAGVRGTPTFFLNGERLEGHWRELARLVPAALDGEAGG